MKAEIIAIGSELTCGARLDTNSQWLSRELESRGWTVQRHTTVADDRAAMVRTYQEAAQRSSVVLITGGLGPTLDDITRETLAEAFEQRLIQDDDSLRQIEAMFHSRGREMPERNKVQALRPENSTSIHNAHGTAPGILMAMSDPNCTIAVMPGVPAEMKLMFHEQIADRLPQSSVVVQRSVIRTFGFGESDIERKLGNLTARGCNPEVGITASQAIISLSITARAGTADECQLLTNSVRERIYDRLGDAIFGEGEAELYQTVAEHLAERGIRIALLEGATTGGLLGQWLTENPRWATQLAHSRLFPTINSIQADSISDSCHNTALKNMATALLETNTADFVLISSPCDLVDAAGVKKQTGHVRVLGHGMDQTRDVSMTGNLAIFRQRAARSALNELRLHLLRNGAFSS